MTRIFEPNDFDAVFRRYFLNLIESGSVIADPSGWEHTETEACIPSFPPPTPEVLGHYITDNRALIAPQKEVLLSLLQGWDVRKYRLDEVTVVPSISTASMAVLLMLRHEHVRTVFFETPAYYATLSQADALNMSVLKIPTYHQDRYEWEPKQIRWRSRNPIAIWITQPRYALGTNQNLRRFSDIYAGLRPQDFLVIDETADQLWPSFLSRSATDTMHQNVIKIRGYMKPLGLNALRIAFILHSRVWRPALQEIQWTVGAALDHHSLLAAVHIASKPTLFRSMLAAARARVERVHGRLDKLTCDSHISLSPMENGYLGTAFLEWHSAQHRGASRRHELLRRCRDWKMPVTLGAAMLFARDARRERIRLNYFMPERHLEYCISALLSTKEQER